MPPQENQCGPPGSQIPSRVQTEEQNMTHHQVKEKHSVEPNKMEIGDADFYSKQLEDEKKKEETNFANDGDFNGQLKRAAPEVKTEEQNHIQTREQEASQKQICNDIPRHVSFPQPMDRKIFSPFNLPTYNLGERICSIPPLNMWPGPPIYNPPGPQIGEKFCPLPPLNMDPRFLPHDMPRDIPERIFIHPHSLMHRHTHYNIPGDHMKDKMYAPLPLAVEQKGPRYSMPPNQMDKIYFVPQTKIEENSLQPEGSIRDRDPLTEPAAAQIDKEKDTKAGDSPEKVDVQTTVAKVQPSNENENVTKEDVVKDNSPQEDKKDGQPVENKMRIILRIDKSRIKNYAPYDKNEDSNEKENKEDDVEMSEDADENGIAPPENEVFLHPGEHNQELYQCPNCTFITTNLNFHVAHKKICLNELDKNERKCPHCPHVTNRQYALNKHINTMHTKAVWYTCDFCTYRSTDSSCLRRHKRNVHPDMVGSDLTCQLCAYRCTTEYHLRKHQLKHDDNTILQKHVFIHNPKPRNCEFCDYKCVSPYQMKGHLKKYHHGVGLEDIDCRSDVSLSEVVDDISNAIREAKEFMGHATE
ncbi:hypothetical protein NQ318_021667 [Aromia moschata]|uniref:C2H2-type domain-containing protein n=1 Tax=Aromia moschata TaxID=1265417 RepID=A0AAV8YDS7_9CUCU|nr:hypothetical protein NQ318_021667 [Aromia moschata]